MIQKKCYSKEWIDEISDRLGYNDKLLIEKSIRALSLLEMLASSGCPFIFKGGTALMLILNSTTHRLSIDIDIICPPGTNIEDFLKNSFEYGFSRLEFVERKQREGVDIPKIHSKFFYQLAYNSGNNTESYILLDVLYEDSHYFETRELPIETPFLLLDGAPLLVKTPSASDILGDKLTAFAPNTTGIPYLKNGKSRSMEIIKQLYDVGRLFDVITDAKITSNAFKKIAEVELSYRNLPNEIFQVINDVRNTAICISTRGKEGIGDFNSLQDGIKRISTFIYKQRYFIEDAIVDSAKAAYLATLIEKNVFTIEKYSNDPNSIASLMIEDSLPNKLNKLKKSSLEAYFYWAKASQLLK